MNLFGSKLTKAIRLGNKLIEQGKNDPAVQVFESILLEDPRNVDSYVGLGTAYMQKGGIKNAKRSIIFYRKALLIDFLQLHIHHKIIKVYDRLGDNRGIMSEKKILFIAKTLKNDPNNALANNNMGVIQLKLKSYGAAIKFFKKAILNDKYMDVAQFNLSKALFQKATMTKDKEYRKQLLIESTNELESVMDKGEPNAETLLLKAKILLHIGQPKAALTFCHRASKVDYSLKEIFATQSLIETKLGEITNASRSYDNFQSLKKAEMKPRPGSKKKTPPQKTKS